MSNESESASAAISRQSTNLRCIRGFRVFISITTALRMCTFQLYPLQAQDFVRGAVDEITNTASDYAYVQQLSGCLCQLLVHASSSLCTKLLLTCSYSRSFWQTQLRMIPLILFNQLVIWPLVSLLVIWPLWARNLANMPAMEGITRIGGTAAMIVM